MFSLIRETCWKNFLFQIISPFWSMTSYSPHFTFFSNFWLHLLFRHLNLIFDWRRIYGDMVYTTPLRLFFIFDLVLRDTKNIFCQCYQNYLRHLWLKFCIFQMSGGWFFVAPQRGCTVPHKSRGVFSDILATEVG